MSLFAPIRGDKGAKQESRRGETSIGWVGNESSVGNGEGSKEIGLIFISISGLIIRIEEQLDGRFEFAG